MYWYQLTKKVITTMDEISFKCTKNEIITLYKFLACFLLPLGLKKISPVPSNTSIIDDCSWSFLCFLYEYQVLFSVHSAKVVELTLQTTSMDNSKLVDYVGCAGNKIKLFLNLDLKGYHVGTHFPTPHLKFLLLQRQEGDSMWGLQWSWVPRRIHEHIWWLVLWNWNLMLL